MVASGIVAFTLRTTSAHLSPNYTHLQTIPDETMFQKRCERIQRLPRSQLFDCYYNLPAKRQRVVDGVKILLDIAKESSDWFPPLKSALDGVSALIKHYEVSVELVAVAHN